MHYGQTRIDQLTHELSVLKRLQFGKRSERLDAEQMSLRDEAIDADLTGLEAELEQLQPATATAELRQQPKRVPSPSKLPRTDIHHEPEDTTCKCGCQRERVGEDISEMLDYAPSVDTVERHIHGKWACRHCGSLI
ncbi:IS66 family transposase zinc-finger binding domain-containing protein [Burkholderia sp. BCC1630]|uniref:IS66 family transposase n=1 Tax=Burkholderia sp. BCC1630 TaxID=2676304 RepID=UPI001FC8E79A|nr:IS66 family transposase zinc-finger binding domain-containing protein [Burkholderia sp. BCC1630]